MKNNIHIINTETYTRHRLLQCIKKVGFLKKRGLDMGVGCVIIIMSWASTICGK